MLLDYGNPYECPFNGSRRHDCECKMTIWLLDTLFFSKIKLITLPCKLKVKIAESDCKIETYIC